MCTDIYTDTPTFKADFSSSKNVTLQMRPRTNQAGNKGFAVLPDEPSEKRRGP
jgi:hypothetical protein